MRSAPLLKRQSACVYCFGDGVGDCVPGLEDGVFAGAPAFPPFALEPLFAAPPFAFEPLFAAPPLGVVALPGAAPVVAGAEAGAVVATGRSLPVHPHPAHHQTPMPIAISTMMPMIHPPELSVAAGRRRRFGLFGS